MNKKCYKRYCSVINLTEYCGQMPCPTLAMICTSERSRVLRLLRPHVRSHRASNSALPVRRRCPRARKSSIVTGSITCYIRLRFSNGALSCTLAKQLRKHGSGEDCHRPSYTLIHTFTHTYTHAHAYTPTQQ